MNRLWSCLLSVLAGLAASSVSVCAEEPLDLARLGAQLAEELSVFSKCPFVSYTSKIEALGEDRFLAAIGASQEYKHGVRTLEFRADQECYLWKTHTDYDSGRRGQVFHGGWSGSFLQLLTFDGQPTLMLTKNRWTYLGSTFVDSNSLFLPFAFLTPHGDLDNKVACSLKELATPDAFLAAWRRAASLEPAVIGAVPCYSVKFPSEGYSDVVYFRASKPFYPIGFDRYRPDGSLHRRYRVEELKQTHDGGPWYPATASYEWFMQAGKLNMKTYTTTHRIQEISVSAPLKPISFTLDTKNAEMLFDRDTRTWIKLK